MSKRGARFWVTIGAIGLTAGAALLDLVGAGMDVKEEFDISNEELEDKKRKEDKED
jgi:hypothetical protein